MQAVQHRREQRTQQERPGEWPHLALFEELGRSDDGVLHAECIRGDERLAGPLVQRIGLGAGKDVALGGQDPAHDGVVHGDAEDGAEDLREEDGARGDMHVVSDFLVLEHVLRAVPGVAGDGAVGGGPAGVPVALAGLGVHHVAVDELVEGANGKLVVRDGVEEGEGEDQRSGAPEGDEDGPDRDPEVAAGDGDDEDDEAGHEQHQVPPERDFLVGSLENVEAVGVLVIDAFAFGLGGFIPGPEHLEEVPLDLGVAKSSDPCHRRRDLGVVEECRPDVLEPHVHGADLLVGRLVQAKVGGQQIQDGIFGAIRREERIGHESVLV